jgi:hypothetical protein
MTTASRRPPLLVPSLCLALSGLACVSESGRDALIRTIVVTRNPDKTISRSEFFTTAAQMALEKEQKLAWIEQKKQGLIAVTVDPSCSMDSAWVYSSTYQLGQRCCIGGTGGGSIQELCGPGWAGWAPDAGPPADGTIVSMLAGNGPGYVLNEQGARQDFEARSRLNWFLIHPWPSWITIEPPCGSLGRPACPGNFCYQGKTHYKDPVCRDDGGGEIF